MPGANFSDRLKHDGLAAAAHRCHLIPGEHTLPGMNHSRDRAPVAPGTMPPVANCGIVLNTLNCASETAVRRFASRSSSVRSESRSEVSERRVGDRYPRSVEVPERGLHVKDLAAQHTQRRQGLQHAHR